MPNDDYKEDPMDYRPRMMRAREEHLAARNADFPNVRRYIDSKCADQATPYTPEKVK